MIFFYTLRGFVCFSCEPGKQSNAGLLDCRLVSNTGILTELLSYWEDGKAALNVFTTLSS